MKPSLASSAGGSNSPSYAETLAARIQEAHAELSARWLVALNAILPVGPNEVFPSRNLLDHIPAVLHEIGGYLRAPASEEIAANTSVLAKAQELGLMRHQQQASVHQLLREYELLGRVLEDFVGEETDRLALEPSPQECLAVMTRLHRSVQILMQTTVDTFIGQYADTIQQQTDRLQSFNRTVSHELRNPLGTLQLALALVQRDASKADAPRWFAVMQRSVEHMVRLIHDLEQLSRARAALDTPAQQRVEVGAVAHEVARQLREMADPRGVELAIAPDLPTLHVDAARLELVLMNLVSNAIKYADPVKPRRVVDICRGEGSDGTAEIAVRDNGLGIPAEALPQVFERFFRAHAEHDQALGNDGSGLGLAIVRECVEAMKGTIRVASEAGVGTTFTIELPDQPEPPAA